MYEDLSATLFVSGYLTGMVGERDEVKPYMLQHFQKLMDDAESYGLEPVSTYHAIWLQQMKQGRAFWSHEEKMTFSSKTEGPEKAIYNERSASNLSLWTGLALPLTEKHASTMHHTLISYTSAITAL